MGEATPGVDSVRRGGVNTGGLLTGAKEMDSVRVAEEWGAAMQGERGTGKPGPANTLTACGTHSTSETLYCDATA